MRIKGAGSYSTLEVVGCSSSICLHRLSMEGGGLAVLVVVLTASMPGFSSHAVPSRWDRARLGPSSF